APGRWLLAGLGSFFLVMALVQAWPGRGTWQGATPGRPSSVATMVRHMAVTPQPAPLDRLISGFGSFTASHGFIVNAVAVAALATIGIGLASRRGALLLPVTAAAAVFCLAVWLFVQDLGVFGGLGTGPNSMPPLLLLIACGYLAATRSG